MQTNVGSGRISALLIPQVHYCLLDAWLMLFFTGENNKQQQRAPLNEGDSLTPNKSQLYSLITPSPISERH